MLAYGANACPDRLVDKGLDAWGAALLPAVGFGWATAWEARRSRTGAVPLTLVRAPGERLESWVLGLPVAALARLDASEGRGERYVLGCIGDVAVAARWRLPRALAYGPAGATRVLVGAGGRPLRHPTHDQRAAAAALEAGGREPRRVEGLPDAVPHGWPATPLEPLDLFVYGTLQPGGTYWPRIAGSVEVVGAARVAGRLTDTGRGWPAADLHLQRAPDEGGPVVHGTLLRPHDRSAAQRAIAGADLIEAEGDLFERVAVRAEGPDGEGWAAAYRWHPRRGGAPGRELPDGHWRVGD